MGYRYATYEAYEAEVRSLLEKMKYPAEYIDELINRGDVKNQFDHDKLSSQQDGADRMNPSGLASCCWMLYPDFPDVPPVDKTGSVFDFGFQSVRKGKKS